MSKQDISNLSTDRLRFEIERRQQGIASTLSAATDWTTDELIAVVLDRNARDIERQHAQAARWASLLIRAGYFAELHGTGQPAPFDREWRVFGPGWNGPRVAMIDIDGCGASWHGDDALWLAVIGPSEGVTK